MASSPNVLREFSPGHSLFRRCIPCPDSPPPCNCGPNETCAEISRSCNQCATMTCIANSAPTPTPAPSSGSNAGAIAGGVIGGLAFIGILIFLIWWFAIRKKRQEAARTTEQEKINYRQARQSTRSMASIASTVLTRASNVIQIAYIPGVTNRSTLDTPGTLVPPVPPLPGASPDQHFFMPGDLRGTGYSDATTVDRRSIATSLARSSVATTIYRSDAIVSPVPAQQALRGKAAMVSVRPSTSTSLASDATSMRSDVPAVPAITQAQLAKVAASSSIVARSVVAKPVNVKSKRPARTKVPAVSEDDEASDSSSSSRSVSVASHSRARRFDNHNSTFDSSSDDDSDDDATSRRRRSAATSLLRPKSTATRQSTATTMIENSPSIGQGPFADQSPTQISAGGSPVADTASSARVSAHSKSDSVHRHRNSVGSGRLLEGGNGPVPERSQSPFSDAHEVK